MLNKFVIGGTVVVVVLAVVYYKGTQSGKQDQLRDTVEAIRTRGGVDERVSKMDDYRLCLSVGGLPNKCEQLRGLDKTAVAK